MTPKLTVEEITEIIERHYLAEGRGGVGFAVNAAADLAKSFAEEDDDLPQLTNEQYRAVLASIEPVPPPNSEGA
jgi:hypothetical protein